MRLSSEPEDITELLRKIKTGDVEAEQELAPLVYEELRRLARNCMRRERSDHTLQTTGLVHEAYLRLIGSRQINDWRDRNQFFWVAADVMRKILVDYARARKAAKRGGGIAPISLAGGLDPATCESWDKILDLHNALSLLAEADQRAARVVELRFFAGLSLEEIADLLDISVRTVKRDWEFSQSWLFAKIANAYSEVRTDPKDMSRTARSSRL